MSGQRWDVLVVKERENQKPWFTKVGSAWESDKGNGNITIILDALPLDGKLLLKLPDEQSRQQGERGQFRQGGGGQQRGGGQRYRGGDGGGADRRGFQERRDHADRIRQRPPGPPPEDADLGDGPGDEDQSDLPF